MARTILADLTRTSWPGTARQRANDPAIHAPLGLAKEDVDARARRRVSRVRPSMTMGID
jgi:hypothetical protein